MDAMAFCLALALIPPTPPRPDLPDWHMLAGAISFHEDLRLIPLERWYWDAALRVWRGQPEAFLAETPQGMACEHYQDIFPETEETASPFPSVVAIDGPQDAPRR